MAPPAAVAAALRLRRLPEATLSAPPKPRARESGARRLAVALLLDGMLDEGGAQAVATILGEQLARRGHAVALVSRWPLDSRSERVQTLRQAGVELITPKWQSRPLNRVWPCEYNLRRAASAVGAARRARALPRRAVLERDAQALATRERAVNDIVVRRLARWLEKMPQLPAVLHVVARHSGAIVGDLRRLGAPIIFSELGQVGHYERGATRFSADAFTADSCEGAEVLRRLEGREVEYVPGIGGFHDPAGPVPPLVTDLVTISRLAPEKRLDVAVRGVALAKGVQLAVHGSGPERERLSALVRELGVAERVRLCGSATRAGVRRALDGAHGFVLASATEGSPTALLEAMSRGRAIVATPVGGVRDLVRDGREALFCDGTPEDLARQLLRLAREPELGTRLGAAARARWEVEYAPEGVVDRYEAVYLRALAETSS